MTDTNQAPAAEPTGAEAPISQEPDGFAVIEKLNAENAELKDRLLRALADVENMRRRSEREAADARAYAISAFARDLLSVADNLARAIESVPAEVREQSEGALKTLAEGVEITARELQATLLKHGVKKLEPQGERFDPNFHQAMYEIPDPYDPGGHGEPGGAERLEDRRARAAPGAGRRLQGRPEAAADSRDQGGVISARERPS